MNNENNSLPQPIPTLPLRDSFKELSQVNVSAKVGKKGKFDYLSWADAWQELKSRFPDSTFTVHENQNEMPFFYDPSLPNLGAFVKVTVYVQGRQHTCTHPVLDSNNRAIKVENLTSFIVNTSTQRALAKAIAMHGLGINLFTGEDFPDSELNIKPISTGSLKPQPTTLSQGSTTPKTTAPEANGELTEVAITGLGSIPVFDIKDDIKKMGFKWNMDKKLWTKKISNDELLEITEQGFNVKLLTVGV